MADDGVGSTSVDARILLADIVADGHVQRVTEVAERAGDSIVGFSEKREGMPFSEVLDGILRLNAEMIASLREGRPPDLTLARSLGVRCCEAQIALTDAQTLRRMIFDSDWRHLLVSLRRRAVSMEVAVDVTAKHWELMSQIDEALVGAYREVEANRKMLRSQRNAVLVDALLAGAMPDPDTTFARLNELMIAPAPFYCVAVVLVSQLGDAPLPNIENLLRRESFDSAWRLDAVAQVGIIAVQGQSGAIQLKDAFVRLGAVSTGISVPVSALEIPKGWRLAQLAAETTNERERVVVFGDNVTNTTAVAASPEVLRLLSEQSLHEVLQLPEVTREHLLATFEKWLDCKGSVRLTALALDRHPNTVRQRLNKIEELTGKSLGNPRDLADLVVLIGFERSKATSKRLL
ncbi:PucR family transcriptional regulator [Mycobacterium sp. C31M]